MLALLALLSAPAGAHPFDAKLYGHRAGVTLYADHLRVESVIEIPTPDLLREMRDDQHAGLDPTQFGARKLRELADGYTLTLDGQPLPTRLVPVEQPGADAKFVAYALVLEADFPRGAHTLRIVDGNYPEDVGYFLDDVQADEDVVVTSSSLVTVEGGRVTRDRDGQWRPEPAFRTIDVAWDVRDGAIDRLGRWLVADPGGVRPTAQAVERPWWWPLASARAAGLLAVLVAPPSLVALVRRRRRRLLR